MLDNGFPLATEPNVLKARECCMRVRVRAFWRACAAPECVPRRPWLYAAAHRAKYSSSMRPTDGSRTNGSQPRSVARLVSSTGNDPPADVGGHVRLCHGGEGVSRQACLLFLRRRVKTTCHLLRRTPGAAHATDFFFTIRLNKIRCMFLTHFIRLFNAALYVYTVCERSFLQGPFPTHSGAAPASNTQATVRSALTGLIRCDVSCLGLPALTRFGVWV